MTEKKITISDYYYKKTEIDTMMNGKANASHSHSNYLTEHQDISMKADKSEIPTKTSDLTNDSRFLTQHQDISGKEDKSNKVTSLSSNSTDNEYPSAKTVYDDVTNKYNTLYNGLNSTNNTLRTHTHGNITNDGKITNQASKNVVTDSNGKITTEAKPTIPTKTSQLTNDSGFLTQHQDISGKADKSEIPTKTSDLTNDSQYVNDTTLSSAVNGLGNYLGGKIANLETLEIVKSNGDYLLEVGGNQKGQTIVIPKNTSDLTNDSGYLTQHQDISGKEDKSNKLTSLDGITPTNDHYPSVMLVIQMLTGLENTLEKTSNKVTSLSSSSTNTQYPSAKAVYDAIPSDTVTLTATLENGTTKSFTIYGNENTGD